ncbi:MAG: GntR family transcriptional regulator [Armatimonas sp.]
MRDLGNVDPDPMVERKNIQARLEIIMLSGKLAPGERISETQIETFFTNNKWPKPSLTLLRGALESLTSEGLIILENRRRRIYKFNDSEKLEIVMIRYLLEKISIKALVQKLSYSTQEEKNSLLYPLSAILEVMRLEESVDVAKFLIADSNFHSTIATQAGLTNVAALLRPIHRKIFLGGYSMVTTSDEGERIINEHGIILKHIENCDEELATLALGRHIIRGGKRWGMNADESDILGFYPLSSHLASHVVPKTREEVNKMLRQIITAVDRGIE